MFRPVVSSIFLAWAAIAHAAPLIREAPNGSATPADQLALAGNACGPTALLNAFRFGNASWQQAAARLPGQSDRERVAAIVRTYGMRPSQHLAGKPRWSKKGVNLADLADIANEMTRGLYLPAMHREVLFLQERESSEQLLRRTHGRIATSLSRGLPPVMSLRRYVKRGTAGRAAWPVLDAHFVTIKSVPAKLERGAPSFPVTYIDPWGGQIAEGWIAISSSGVLAAPGAPSPCLEANFPKAAVGKKLVRKGEQSSLTVAALLGRW